MFHKSIFQGRLYFNNERSFGKAQEMFLHKIENSFKSIDILFELEDIFNEEELQIAIPRTVKNVLEKSFKSTVNLLEYMAQFSVAGNIGAWMMEEGSLKHYAWIEPHSDKSIVQHFIKGKESLSEDDTEKALEHLNKVIKQYDKHSQAYERRGFVNYILGKYADAQRDFEKSVSIDDENSMAYLGLARVRMKEGEYQEAIKSLVMVTKTAVALQDIHWTARRLLADCYIETEAWEKAEFELKFFTKRKFSSTSLNKKYVRKALYQFGNVLMHLEKYNEALHAFDRALDMKNSPGTDIEEAHILLQRGKVRQSMGKTGFIADWKKASELGLKDANMLLTRATA